MAATRVDINTASKEELTQLSAIDEDRLETLLQQRPFHDWSEIDELPGFSSRLVEEIQQEGAYLGAQEEETAEYLEEEDEELEQW